MKVEIGQIWIRKESTPEGNKGQKIQITKVNNKEVYQAYWKYLNNLRTGQQSPDYLKRYFDLQRPILDLKDIYGLPS